MSITLQGLNNTPRSDTLNSVSEKSFASVTAGAGVVNTAIQATAVLPFNFKIRKVAVYFTAIDNVAGTDSFNIVVGTGAYIQTNAAPNDNSFDPQSNTTVGTGAPQNGTPVLGGVGYPTNIATAGMTVFGADVAFNVANFPAITTGGGSNGVVWLVPGNYDAVYSGLLPLTLRATTVATTGSITNLTVALLVTPVRLRPFPVGSQVYYATPGVDY